MYGCMSFCNGRSDYKRFYILLDIVFSSTVVNSKITKPLKHNPGVLIGGIPGDPSAGTAQGGKRVH